MKHYIKKWPRKEIKENKELKKAATNNAFGSSLYGAGNASSI